nr:secreted RxLR effector protein 161-like [Nicotiana tomentosiformis]
MDNANTIDTPIATATRLYIDELGTSIDENKYRSITGSLLYLTASRPDAVYNMGLCARIHSSPKETHLKDFKRILKYLKRTQDLVLWYLTGDSFELIRYADADYARYLMDMKNTSGMILFLGSCSISWESKK